MRGSRKNRTKTKRKGGLFPNKVGQNSNYKRRRVRNNESIQTTKKTQRESQLEIAKLTPKKEGVSFFFSFGQLSK